jgi:hypothetical protein
MMHKLFPCAPCINNENCLMHPPDYLVHTQISSATPKFIAHPQIFSAPPKNLGVC